MATYTDNYNLIKPTYAEVADIVPLNNNFEKIDEVMHSSQISLAPAYDQTKEYAAGDTVMYELLMYKCTASTTGVWDPSKWERTTASESGGGGSAELDILGEASGAVASFADGASAGLAKCIVDINPVQDLHGYSKPWAGGAGKNKIPLIVNDIKTLNSGFTWNDNSFTYNGVTVTLNTDPDGNLTKISTNGTCLGNFDIKIAKNLSISSGTYILSGSIGGNASKYYLQGFGDVDYTSGSGILETDGETSFTLTATNNLTLRLYIRNTADMTGIELYPMIRESSESSGFEPYTNICPINGHSSVTINVSPTDDPEEGQDITIQLGDTYYGGILNVGKGELTATHRVITENDFISVSSGTSGGGLHYANCDLSEPEATSANATSNMLAQNQSGWGSTTPCFATNTGSAPNIYPVRIYCSESTLADFKAAYSGLQICYELATPITVQLTPQEVNSLLGQNNISADTGDIDVVYVKASAPIQPNPTGTPTATLKKLGIEGTVFELPSGGGGSSAIDYSTEEQDTGMRWIDGRPIYQKTVRFQNVIPKNSWVQHSFGLVDADNIIKVEFNRIRTDNGVDWSVNYNNSGSYFSAYWAIGGLTLYWDYGNASSVDVITTIQYTKITD